MSEIGFAELISKIAHELRSPLTSVKGFSATLIKRWDRFDDKQRFELVETIHADAERMGRIVSEVLDLARLESGQFELHAAQVAVAPIAEQAVAHLGELPGADRVEVDVDPSVSVWADPERLGHVLSNLIENAIKFSEDGPITIGTHPSTEHVAIEVTDRGAGIAQERIAVIFSGPAPTAQISAPSGTGLGLYLTRRLVEAHGGSIGVESTFGKGSTFTVVLPSSGEPG